MQKGKRERLYYLISQKSDLLAGPDWFSEESQLSHFVTINPVTPKANNPIFCSELKKLTPMLYELKFLNTCYIYNRSAIEGIPRSGALSLVPVLGYWR